MNTSRSILVPLFVLALLLDSAVCQRNDGRKQRNAQRTTGTTPECTGKARDQLYLVPFLKQGGTPVACLTDFWTEAMKDECMNRPGVPFKAELPLTLAIWSQGTVIWRACPNGREAEYCEATVPQETVSKLLDAIDLKELARPENVRYSDEALSRYCPASVIMVSKGGSRVFLCTQLGAMELLQEYWVWEDSEQRTFPFSRYSFDEFCKQLPDAYNRHLRQFAGLRTQLKAILPANGRRIVLQDRVLWTVTTPGNNSHETGEPDKSNH